MINKDWPEFNGNEILGRDKTCPMCGKEFLMKREYAYKREERGKMTFFCSWHCLREYDRKHEGHGIAHGQGKDPNRHAKEIMKMLKDGWETSMIMRELRVTKGTVQYYRRKLFPKEETDE